MSMLNKIKKSKAIEVETTAGGKNVISLSLTNNDNGKRVTLSPGLYKCLGCPKSLQFAINEDDKELFIAEKLFDDGKTYMVSGKGKGILYNAALVELITKTMDVDFSSCTSKTFRDIEIEKIDDVNVACVKF